MITALKHSIRNNGDLISEIVFRNRMDRFTWKLRDAFGFSKSFFLTFFFRIWTHLKIIVCRNILSKKKRRPIKTVPDFILFPKNAAHSLCHHFHSLSKFRLQNPIWVVIFFQSNLLHRLMHHKMKSKYCRECKIYRRFFYFSEHESWYCVRCDSRLYDIT